MGYADFQHGKCSSRLPASLRVKKFEQQEANNQVLTALTGIYTNCGRSLESALGWATSLAWDRQLAWIAPLP
jgi:hypothetical protein